MRLPREVDARHGVLGARDPVVERHRLGPRVDLVAEAGGPEAVARVGRVVAGRQAAADHERRGAVRVEERFELEPDRRVEREPRPREDDARRVEREEAGPPRRREQLLVDDAHVGARVLGQLQVADAVGDEVPLRDEDGVRRGRAEHLCRVLLHERVRVAVELAVVATELHEREGGGERRRDRRGERGGGAHRGGRALEQGREADAGERREVEVRLLPEAGEDAAEEARGDGEVAKGHHHGDREHRRDERDQPDAARPSPPVPRGHPRAHEREQEARDAEVCARCAPPRGEHVPRGDLRADPHRREAERAVLAAKDVRPEAVPRGRRRPHETNA